MTERAQQLHATADEQITDLTEFLTTTDPASFDQPCAGREKLGDGTVGALAAHTVENYQRIGAFAATADRMTADGRHRARPDGHAQGYTADNANPTDLVARLSAARRDLEKIAELTDSRLDTVPPKDSFRFCDGQRTLEDVLSGLLKHQARQLDALRAAIG